MKRKMKKRENYGRLRESNSPQQSEQINCTEKKNSETL